MNPIAGSAGLFALLTCFCSRSSDSPGDNANPGGSALASAALAPSAAPAPQKLWFEGRWSGTYQAELERIELPKGGIRAWKDDDGTKASGAGTLNVSVTPQGSASGEAKGPLGDQSISGQADDRGFWLELTPKNLDEGAFRGTLVLAERSGDRLRGFLRASSGDSLTVRKAKVELGRSASP